MSDSRTGQQNTRPAAFRPRPPRRGFTLVELLVVVGIIVILIGILIPTISHVRQASRAASTQALLTELQGAIEQYYQDYRAYPGPLSNDVMYGYVGTGLLITDPNHISNPSGTPLPGRVSGSENLVLALMGGLRYDAGFAAGQSHIVYDPTIVGTGPRTLAYDFATGAATAKTNLVKNAYLATAADLTTSSQNNDPANPGHFKDGVGEADDSTIPEFVDRFQSPMPILYLRARVGAANVTITPFGAGPVVIGDANNVRNCPSHGATVAPLTQYDLSQYFGYVGSFTGTWPTMAAVTLGANELPAARGASIGEGKSVSYWFNGTLTSLSEESAIRGAHHGLVSLFTAPTGAIGDTNVQSPFTAPSYFRNTAFGDFQGVAALQNQPRGRDAYILISPGPDRVYGTADDITSFGAVVP